MPDRAPPTGHDPRHALEVDPAELERIAAAGWQPLERERLGGWQLRAAAGFTGRANSVLPLGDPGLPLDDALARVVGWYGDRGLPPRFQVPLPLCEALDAALDARGWPSYDVVDVMVVDLADLSGRAVQADAPEVRLAATPDDAWLATYRYRGRPLPPVALDVLRNADAPVFATVTDRASGPVAVGRAALTPDWVGITALDVAEPARRRGLATAVLLALTRFAHHRGARFGYLQVARDNLPAHALYDRLGFVTHHSYQYRVAATA